MITFKQFLSENEEVEVEVPEEEEIFYPGGVYISVNMEEESLIAISNYMDKYLPNHDTINLENMHCTLIYSKKPYKEEIIPKEYKSIGTFLKFTKFGEKEDVLVAELDCEAMVTRNKELVEEHDFISDFEEYKPHFTLSYNAKDIDINSLPPLDFAIYFENETIDQLDENWEDEDEVYGDETLVGKAIGKHKVKMDKEEKKAEKETKKEEKE